MNARLTRAKRKIAAAGIPYRVPPPDLLPDRLTGVLAVVYLLFNEGYSRRPELVGEAIRLGRVLLALMPGETEVRGLLALMLLQHARAGARTDAEGELVTLDQQDRSRWDPALISEGVQLLTGTRSPYQLQAAIAACHDTAGSAESTDWPRIAALYGELAEVMPSPFVELNRAVAVSMAAGPEAALPLVEELDRAGTLNGYHLLPATRADLLRRLGRHGEAAQAYGQALELAPAEAEQRFLRRRLAEVSR
jgi:RNA polymerase sigma-70 factor (ECF subfamily)